MINRVKGKIRKIYFKIKKIDKEYIIIGCILIFIFCFGMYNYFSKNMKANEKEFENAISKEQDLNSDEIEGEDGKIIYIHLDGMVKKAGLYEVKEGARLKEVIDKAGGLTEKANVKMINFALKVSDGEKIYIPSVDDKEGTDELELFGSALNNESLNETSSNSSSSNSSTSTRKNINEKNTNDKKEKVSNRKININKAKKEELVKINGIGDAMAERIIKYRNEHGKFNQIEDIKEVRGIGDAKFEKLKNSITVS